MPLKNLSKNFNLADKTITKENIAIPQSPDISPKLLATKGKLENLRLKGSSKDQNNIGVNDSADKMHQPDLLIILFISAIILQHSLA
jgi:hypothetical protein